MLRVSLSEELTSVSVANVINVSENERPKLESRVVRTTTIHALPIEFLDHSNQSFPSKIAFTGKANRFNPVTVVRI